MVSSFETITDNLPNLEKLLEELKQSDVLVGIPEQQASRQAEKINSAELLYIHTHGIRQKRMRQEMQEQMDGGDTYSEAYQLYLHEHGSPLWHSPPRPVLEPAIEDCKEEISAQLGRAAGALFDRNLLGFTSGLHRAGQVAENGARGWFTNPKNNWAPNSPATAEMKGSSNPLIDTGQMRKAITHVVRKKGVDIND